MDAGDPASPDYRSGHLLVVITADTSQSAANGNLLATILVNPDIPAGTAATARFDHYSLLRLDEELLGLDAARERGGPRPTCRPRSISPCRSRRRRRRIPGACLPTPWTQQSAHAPSGADVRPPLRGGLAVTTDNMGGTLPPLGPVPAPLFLVGSERSGSTLLRLMLDHHPEIAFAREFDFVVDRVSATGGSRRRRTISTGSRRSGA